MEKIEKILKWISGYGDGSGDGYGYGSGDGSGSGSGSGYGSGDGSDDGDGTGYGSDYGSGYGDGSGSGYGTGSGDGDGDGYGYGYGYGYGDGSGDGYGYGSVIKIKKLNNDLVFYIDGIPTIIDKIRGNIAKCRMIDENDFSSTFCYVAKEGKYFAHEIRMKKAVESVKNKMYSEMDVDGRINQFYNQFDYENEYNSESFFEWHNILTGSCLAGREEFVKSHNINMDKKYTVKEFIEICKNAYGGEIIKKLEQKYKGVKNE